MKKVYDFSNKDESLTELVKGYAMLQNALLEIIRVPLMQPKYSNREAEDVVEIQAAIIRNMCKFALDALQLEDIGKD